MKDARLNDLLDRYLDARLTAAEKLELERTLKESSAARRHFWQYTPLHAFTHDAAKLKWSEHPETETAGEKVSSSSGAPAKEHWRPAFWWAGWRWSWARSLAAGMALLLVTLSLFQVWKQNRTVAVLVRALDAEWMDGAESLAEGAALKADWLRLKRGSVLVEFKGGARVAFEAPAEFRIVSPREAFCRLGRFSAQVPARARGFKLRADGLEVIDLGTEFGLSKPPVGNSEVHVFLGKVDLIKDGKSPSGVLLSEGEAMRLESNAWTRLPSSHAGFLNETDLLRRALPAVRQREESWKEASRLLDADPGTILHYTFQEETAWDRVLTNQVSKLLDASHGNIHGCEWIEGRWPGKKALAFQKPGDRVRLQLPHSFNSMTCLIWVRVDGLTNGFVHSLLTSDREAPGSLRWTISQKGNIRLGLANKSSSPEANWTVGISPTVVTNERLGKWLMVATVYDGKQISHYIDGRLIGSSSVAGPGAISFGWVELGNWVATPDHPDFQWAKGNSKSYFARNLTGRIDEVAVLARVMTAGEIQRYYEAGRPVEFPALAAQPLPAK